VPLSVQAARVWAFCASSEIERGKSVGLLLVRAPPYLCQAHAWHGHPDEVAALCELAEFLALAADGILVWVGASHRTTTNFSHETLGRDTEWPLLVAGDPEAGRQARHRGSGAEVHPVEHAHGWLRGRVAGPFGHHEEIGKPSATRRGME
jgi:hypothetical protein